MKKKQAEQIAKRNKAFRKAPKFRKRLIIARDVLAQQAASRLIAKAGVYLSSPVLEDLAYDRSKINTQLQTILSNTPECRACALGGLFNCGVQIANKLTLGETSSIYNYGKLLGSDAYTYLTRFFDLNQLLLIETAFERKDMQREHRENNRYQIQENGTLSYDEVETAKAFGEDVDDDADRLRLIMENIIINKGTFDPYQKPVQVWRTAGFKG
jgi:hypothetical protein